MSKIKHLDEKFSTMLRVGVEEYLKLWQTLIDDSPKLPKVGYSLDRSSVKILDCIHFWNTNQGLNLANMPSKRLYAQFIIKIMNRESKGNSIFTSYLDSFKKKGLSVQDVNSHLNHRLLSKLK